MWRVRDSFYYRFILGLVLCVEVALLIVLMGAFIIAFFYPSGFIDVLALVMTSVGVTVIGLGLLLIFGVISQLVSRYRFNQQQRQLDLWLGEWTELIFADTPITPSKRLSEAAIEALMQLPSILGGAHTSRLHEIFRAYHLHHRYVRRLNSRSLLRLLDALERLARMRLPETLPPVSARITHRNRKVALMAAKTAAYILNTPEADPDHIPLFLSAIAQAHLPGHVLESTLVHTGQNAEAVLRGLLQQPDIAETLLISAMSVAGRLRLHALAPYIALRWEQPSPQVRAVCLRALAQLQRLPGDSHHALKTAIEDPEEVVRIQAARALALLPLHHAYALFWKALHDSSSWVRLAAADTLWRKGPNGQQMLHYVAEIDSSSDVRQIARYILTNAGDGRTDEWIWSR
jgi:ABC-type multidrug transport system fused ATPase/permease subunit